MNRYRTFFIIVVLALVAATLLLQHGAAQKSGSEQKSPQQGRVLTPTFVPAVNFAESAPARTFPAAKPRGSVKAEVETETPSAGEEEESREINPLNTERTHTNVPGPSRDAALQTSTRPTKAGPLQPAALPAPSLTFEGLDFTNGSNVAPPDTNGDVGPNDYVETVNNLVRVYDKNGNPRGPIFQQSSLFANLGGLCAASDKGDPVVLYDRMANRWLISQFGFTLNGANIGPPPYHECIAISRTPDPTGSYFLYDFTLPGTEFPDYPKFGVWPDGYYMTSNQFNNGGPFDGTGAFGFDRQKMLVGNPTAGLIYFNLNLTNNPEGVFGMLPSDQDGILPPPAGAPNVFIYFTNTLFGDPADGLRLFNFHADFTTPANSTFAESQTTYATPLALAAFDARIPGGRAHVEQPPPAGNNTTDRLDSVGERMMFPLQYQNRNGVESLVSNFTVNVSGVAPTSGATFQAGFRYFELQRTGSNPYAVTEQATFAPGAGNGATGDNRWMGSAAADNQDNLAVGYSISGVTPGHNPSLNYAARAFNDPPGGLFQGEGTMFAGTGVQRGTSNRWGDYSSLHIDPSDDCTFWYADEYYTSTTLTFNWQTRIGKFKFPTCTAPQQGTLAGTITACDTGQPLQDAVVTVTGGPSNGFSTTTLPNGTYSMNVAPGTYTVTVTDSVRSCATTLNFNNVGIINGATTTQNGCLTGSPSMAFQSAAVFGGNGNGVIDGNECDNLNVTIQNIGCLTGTGISATLSTSTPGVTVTQPNSNYPNVNENGSATNTLPFTIVTSSSYACGTPINFTLNVTTAQGPFTINFSMPTCTISFSGNIANTDPTQTGRLTRNGVASSCASPKAYPGANDATVRHFDQYSFTNTTASTACVTATVSNTCASNIFPVAYLGSYNPASISTNYLADPGVSSGTVTWSFNVPAGQTLVLVINEITANAGCSSYSGTISGLFVDGGATCIACAGDFIPPTITCPASITKFTDSGQFTATVNPGTPVANDNCGLRSVVGVRSDGQPINAPYPLGVTIITWTATDLNGNQASCTQTIMVNTPSGNRRPVP